MSRTISPDDFVAIADSVVVLDFRRREDFDAMLDPKPVINNNRLEFRNRVKMEADDLPVSQQAGVGVI